MRHSGKGGMQTGGANYAIYCPVCGKPAARKEPTETGYRYLHFTKKGSVWHVQEAQAALEGREGQG